MEARTDQHSTWLLNNDHLPFPFTYRNILREESNRPPDNQVNQSISPSLTSRSKALLILGVYLRNRASQLVSIERANILVGKVNWAKDEVITADTPGPDHNNTTGTPKVRTKLLLLSAKSVLHQGWLCWRVLRYIQLYLCKNDDYLTWIKV